MRNSSFIFIAVLMTGCVSQDRPPQSSPPGRDAKPPVAQKIPKADVRHGERRVDQYFWLRHKTNASVRAYLEAENAYADAVMKPTEALQETLYQEMLSHIKETDLSVPFRKGDFFYYFRTEQGQQYPIHCRKHGSLQAAEQIVLDLNELAKGQKFLSLGAYQVSDDGNWLAYSTDVTGFREYTLSVKDLRTGQLLPDRVEKTSSVAWAADHRTLFYAVDDHAKRPFRIFKHRIGASQDELVYEEKDERFRVTVWRSRSRAYLFLSADSHTASEIRCLPAAQLDAPWKLIVAREPDHEYDVDHHGDFFYIRSNAQGRNFRLVRTPVADPGKSRWQEIIPHRPDVMLEGMSFFTQHYVLQEREGGLPHLRVTDLRTGQSHRIQFPEPAYSAFPQANAEFDTKVFRYGYQSLVTPNSVFDYDMETREAKLLKQTEVPGGFESSNYQSERLHAMASDGTQVPISLVRRKGAARDGRSPMVLTGYGSYGSSFPVTFDSNRLSLLDRGVVFAIAHIRGGGDMGKAWHDEGRMLKKMNTFTDFIAAAEFLVSRHYTSRDRLVITGGSAGGLLMGAVTNLRPDLFKAVVSHVPFVDVLNTMLDESLPLTVGEFEEWGNPKNKEEYDYMRRYCPYTNLKRGAYPSMLVKTSFNDSQVMYWEPAKYVAKLRALKQDQSVLLLKTNMAAGHGGASGRYDRLREISFDYAFILARLGIGR